MRVLVSAYACSPGRGSEPGVGWNLVRQLGERHEVWVITRRRRKDEIEAELAKCRLPNVHWVFFDFPRWSIFWKRKNRGVHLYYYLWQIAIYFVARKLHKETRFDLVHHVTFVNYWMPSFLSLLDVPFVWGPVGGGESAPDSFWKSFGLRGKFYESLRHLARHLGEHDPFVRITGARCACALATTEETAARLKLLGCRHVSILPQVALSEDELRQLGSVNRVHSDKLRILSIGRLYHVKGIHLGIAAFAKFHAQHPASEYRIIGRGAERRVLEKQRRDLGLENAVIFRDEMPRSQVFEQLAQCDVLLHPTLHDSGGWVSLEAMAAGCPVVCLDLGGPALQVTSDTGIKIPALTPDQAIDEIAHSLLLLSENKRLLKEMGSAARQRVRERFTWTSKAEMIDQIYTQLAETQSARISRPIACC